MKTRQTSHHRKGKTMSESLPALYTHLDQKLELLRQEGSELRQTVHTQEMELERLKSLYQNELNTLRLELKKLEQKLEQSEHDSQIQHQEARSMARSFTLNTEKDVRQIHFQTREDLHALSRRLETIERLIL